MSKNSSIKTKKTFGKPSIPLGIAIFVGVIVIDHLTKFIALKTLATNAAVWLLPFLGLTITYNKGIAFGFLPQAAIIYPFISGLFILGVGYFFRKSSVPMAYFLALVAGGAAGNLIDRFIHGHVIDWIWITGFSVFNLADCAITIGAALIILWELKKK